MCFSVLSSAVPRRGAAVGERDYLALSAADGCTMQLTEKPEGTQE